LGAHIGLLPNAAIEPAQVWKGLAERGVALKLLKDIGQIGGLRLARTAPNQSDGRE
jgi:hypothetical protein